MNIWPALLFCFLGLGGVLISIPLILKGCSRGLFGDRARDLHHTHDRVIPRCGGLALAGTFILLHLLVSAFFMEPPEVSRERWVMLACSLAMFGLGFWDDLKPLGARKKLLGQILIATVVCCLGQGIQKFKLPFTGDVIELHGWGVIATIVWLVAMTNLVNLVDGVDGLAGGICLMLMSLLAYQGHSTLQLLAAGMAGALLGFLRYNFPPARIYMGDGGAYFLGFQIGLFAISSSQKGTILAALAAPLFVLALPIVDVTLAILRRGLRGLPVFRPDRRHIHHHLINMGLSRRKVVLLLYSVTLVFLLMGFVAFWSRGQLVPILLGLAALVLLLCAGKLSFSREWFAVGRVLGNSLGMRQQIQYALSLTRWLAIEGTRRGSVANLWPDLVFVAHRLGFTSVRLKMADGEKVWEDEVCATARVWQQELKGGLCGVLELKAPPSAQPAPPGPRNDTGDASSPCSCDPKLFLIMCELLAEGWLEAMKRWETEDGKPLKFSSRIPCPPLNATDPFMPVSSQPAAAEPLQTRAE